MVIQWFLDLFRSRSKNKNEEETSRNSLTGMNDEKDFYISDSPLTDPALDVFKRWPFAQRIAQTIVSRQDPSSIVIGIYGMWGEGKTTILNFIEKELEKSPQIICVRFNPWLFKDEIHLLRNFFQTLADALGKSISSQKEKIGEWLQEYAAILAPISIGFGVINLSPSKGAKEIGRTLSSVELDELKKRIEGFLKDEKKRVVILMDDIDRLDKTEIQIVFKLVKLSADFDYTAYVLAFDDEMVANALEEKYASQNEKGAGRSFLEKIVQVPLRLPLADKLSLRKFCFKGVDEALKEAKIKLNKEQVQKFVRYFSIGLEVRLQTPRMAKRYGNALAFSLPVLKDEVNSVDLMLIEGMRIFYPKLYDIVRHNSRVFLGLDLDIHRDNDQVKKRDLEVVNKGLEELNSEENEAAKDLLKVLFPRFNGIFGNTYYGSEWENKWGEGQHISSKQYFNRFFSYTISEDDISDQEIESFLREIENKSIETIAHNIQKLIGDRSADKFVLKLKSKKKKLSPEISSKLAVAIAKTGNSFPNPKTLFLFTTTFSQAGLLVSHLVENVPKGKNRFDVGKLIAQNGQPISFAYECFRWMRTMEEKEEQDRIFSVDEENELGKIIANRIKQLSQEKYPIYIHFPDDTSLFFYAWSHWRSKKETNQYIIKTIDEDLHNVLEFLKCYLTTEWDMEGIPHRGDLGSMQYDSIAKVVDPDLIYKKIYKIYGSDLDSPKHINNNDKLLDKRVAHQFARIYHIKTEEQKNQKSKGRPLKQQN